MIPIIVDKQKGPVGEQRASGSKGVILFEIAVEFIFRASQARKEYLQRTFIAGREGIVDIIGGICIEIAFTPDALVFALIRRGPSERDP